MKECDTFESKSVSLYQVTLCKQTTVACVTESDIGQGTSNHTPPLYELLISVVWFTLNFGRPAEECTKN